MLNVERWTLDVFAALLLSTAPASAEDVAKLIEDLRAPVVATRREAAYQLDRLGPAAKDAVPVLIKALDDSDKQVWSLAISAIAKIGPDAKDAIPALLDGLDARRQRGGRDRDRRQTLTRSAFALSRIGPAAIAPLTAALGADDTPLRIGATKALGGMGAPAHEAIPALIKNLAHTDADLRRETIDALAAIGGESVKPLVEAIDFPDAKLREGAALALAQLATTAREAAPALLSRLGKENEAPVRAALFTTLPKTGADPEQAVSLLVKGVCDDDERVRHAAINALAPMRAGRAFAVPALAELLKGGDSVVKPRAARALGRIGADAAPSVPALIDAARTAPDEPAFANALSEIGPTAMPALLASLKSAPPSEHNNLLKLLRGFGLPAVPVLIEALKTDEPATRASAARVLGGMGRDARPALDSLFALAVDPVALPRAAALRALIALNADAGRVKPLLETALKDSAPEVRRAGAAGMAAQGGAGALGVDGLIELLADDDIAGRRAAVDALGALGEKAASAVPALSERIGDASLRVIVIAALGKIGPAAASAVPRFLEISANGNTELQVAVLLGLSGIGREAAAALPNVYAALRSGEADIRAAAATALGTIETDAEKAVAALTPLTADETGRVRRPTAIALSKFGARARSATPQIIAMLEREPDRGVALTALQTIGVRSVPDLLHALEMREPQVRVFACGQLATLGADARDAVPKLRELAEAEPQAVKDAARSALAKIAP